MADIVSEGPGMGKSAAGVSNGQHNQSGEALAEWRSSDQVENGTPSTSPSYWDTDDDDEGGPKPSDLYGKYTWKIENFSEIKKRELRSNAFEVGGYKWYILIYPQGCDVCNHLSLFLCVANHDKLLPGWSHFAQFTIAVVNKEPKKSKYSDTLHRFWKKEHDWGWKKFMELPKLQDGFIDDSDSLIIKAQVQVIRERADRPFRCLDCQYKRELVRVYLTNVEQICRRFVEERRSKLGRLIEDKARWSSFCAFWLGMDQNSRRRMSREKMDVIVKVVVKHFFIEKEVTSTLVMDSLHSGLKALEGQTKNKKNRARLLDAEEMPAPIVSAEKDMFILVDDVLLLLERAALEPLPPKDDKGPQNRTKEGNSGEDFNKEAIERDERRLTELGRRTVEIFVLAHIFSNKIEVAYQEAIALKRQEELIREEEAAWLAESEQKAKKGAAEKEKKSKKKQGKQKRNKGKGKDKRREEKVSSVSQEKHSEENHCDEEKDTVIGEIQPVPEKADILEDVSDASDSVDGSAEVTQPDLEDRDASPVNWDTDTSEIHHPSAEGNSSGIGSYHTVLNGVTEKKGYSIMDDSSSTCSTDSVPSVVNGSYKGNFSNYQNQMSPGRVNDHRGKVTCETSSLASETDDQPSTRQTDGRDQSVSESSKTGESESEISSVQDPKRWPEHHSLKKECNLLQKRPNVENSVSVKQLKEKTSAVPSSPNTPQKNLSSVVQPKSDHKGASNVDMVSIRKPSNSSQPSDLELSTSDAPLRTVGPKPEMQKVAAAPYPAERPATKPVTVISRPSSAPIIPPSRLTAPAVSVVQANPLIPRSVSSAGRLGPDLSVPTQRYVPQSYRNAIVGQPVGPSSLTHMNALSSGVSQPLAYSQPPPTLASFQSGLALGTIKQDMLPSEPHRNNISQRATSISLNHDIQNAYPYAPITSGFQDRMAFSDIQAGRLTQCLSTDEFPHLDIINDLLNDEHAGNAERVGSVVHVLPQLNYQYAFPGDHGVSGDMLTGRFNQSSYYDDPFQQAYSSSSSNFDPLGEFMPNASLVRYTNGHIDGLGSSHWPSANMDLSLPAMRNRDGDGYQYFGADPLNSGSNINGFIEFRPRNGHRSNP